MKGELERKRRLNQMLRVATNRMRRFGLSRRRKPISQSIPVEKSFMRASDCHIEVRRLLGLLGRQDEADAIEATRKQGYAR